jgi:hypothetical protein
VAQPDLFTVHIEIVGDEFPGQFVLRGWTRDTDGLVPQEAVWAVADSLLDLSDALPDQAICLLQANPRDPTLIEVWV